MRSDDLQLTLKVRPSPDRTVKTSGVKGGGGGGGATWAKDMSFDTCQSQGISSELNQNQLQTRRWSGAIAFVIERVKAQVRILTF